MARGHELVSWLSGANWQPIDPVDPRDGFRAVIFYIAINIRVKECEGNCLSANVGQGLCLFLRKKCVLTASQPVVNIRSAEIYSPWKI